MSDIWGNVAAAIGGGLHGGYSAYEHDQDEKRKEEMQAQLLKLRDDIAHLQEAGKTERNTTTVQSKKDIADANRQAKSEEVASKLQLTGDLGWDKSARMWDQGQQKIDTTRANATDAIDSREGMFYGSAMPFKYDALATTDQTRRRGQDMTADVGYDRTAATREGQDTRAGTADANRKARNVLGVLNLKGRAQNSRTLAGVFNPSQKLANPTDWANEFDRLYHDPNATASEALAAGQDAQPSPAAPAAGALPASPPPPAPAAPPAPAGSPVAKPPISVVQPKGGALEVRAKTLIDQIRAADAAGQDSTTLRRQLAALRAQVPR